MKKLCFICLFSVLLISSCSVREDIIGIVNIKVKGLYDGKPWVADELYPYFGNSQCKISRSELYITNLELSGNGKSVRLSDVIYPELHKQNINVEKAKEGISYSFGGVPEGVYTSLEFNVGPDQLNNSKKPTDFSLGSPYSFGERYWDGWNSFIFYKIEGNYIDTKGVNFPFIFHAGIDENNRRISLPIHVEISSSSEEINLVLTLDHKKLFGSESDFIDLSLINNIQGPGPDMKRCVDYYAKAFSVQ